MDKMIMRILRPRDPNTWFILDVLPYSTWEFTTSSFKRSINIQRIRTNWLFMPDMCSNYLYFTQTLLGKAKLALNCSRLLEPQRVAANANTCSKVVGHNWDRHSSPKWANQSPTKTQTEDFHVHHFIVFLSLQESTLYLNFCLQAWNASVVSQFISKIRFNLIFSLKCRGTNRNVNISNKKGSCHVGFLSHVLRTH